MKNTKIFKILGDFEIYIEGGRWLGLPEMVISMLPEIFIFSGNIILFLLWNYKKKSLLKLYYLEKFFNYNLIGIIITFLLLYFNPYFPVKMGGYVQGISISFQITYYTQVIKCFILILFFIFLIGSKQYLTRIFFIKINDSISLNDQINTRYHEYFVFLNFTIGFVFLLISVVNFLVLILCLEAIAFCLYVLIGFTKNSKYSIEAATKYFYYGAMSFGIYCVGMLFLYLTTRGLSFYNILEQGPGPAVLLQSILNLPYPREEFSYDISFLYVAGMLLIFCALIFKLGGAPFHFWVADIYEGSAYPTTIFMGTVVKLGFCGIILKLCIWVFLSMCYFWQPLFLFSGCLSLLVGSFMSFNQKKIKRFFAYSSIVHVGFFLIGVSLIDFSSYVMSDVILDKNIMNLLPNFTYLNNTVISLLYIGTYISTVLVLFLIFLNIIVSNRGVPVIFFSDIQGLRSKLISSNYSTYLISFIMIILFCSMAGIPPFLGFFTKYYIFLLSLKFKLDWLIYIIIGVTLLSGVYYLRILKMCFFEEISNNRKIMVVPVYINKRMSLRSIERILSILDGDIKSYNRILFFLTLFSFFIVILIPWNVIFEEVLIFLNKCFLSVYWPELPLSFVNSDVVRYTVPYKIPFHISVLLSDLLEILSNNIDWRTITEDSINQLEEDHDLKVLFQLFQDLNIVELLILSGQKYDEIAPIFYVHYIDYVQNIEQLVKEMDKILKIEGGNIEGREFIEISLDNKKEFYIKWYNIRKKFLKNIIKDLEVTKNYLLVDYFENLLINEQLKYKEMLKSFKELN